MSNHHFNRHTCNCQSSGHSHHKLCGCRMRHDVHHHDFCSCHSSRHHRSIHHDTCKCNRVDRLQINQFRRMDDRLNLNKRNRNSLSRMTPLRHNRHGDMRLSHLQDSHLHGRNHSIGETIRLHKDDDGKKSIVIIM